jgi:2-polyprenyl-6-methoxyphenol hydroxylase-like FAD-dependent oxidoreductase
VVPRFTIRDRDRVLASINFDGLRSRYPYTLMIPQNVTEAILLARLRELGGDVSRPYTLQDLRQDADAVSLTVASDGEAPRTVKARYVVGADGMHSAVRERAGIGFTGGSYEQSFVLADVQMDWPLGHDEVMLFRIVATVDDAPEHPSIADVQRLLETRGPSGGVSRVRQLAWSTRFRVHHRLADRYRAGRVLLAGDAAHVHSPAGGQGMNTGIQDAVVLGHALSAVLRGSGDEKTLDEYERTRRPIANRVVSLTDRMTRMATLRSRPSRALRNGFLEVAGRIPGAMTRVATAIAGLNNR